MPSMPMPSRKPNSSSRPTSFKLLPRGLKLRLLLLDSPLKRMPRRLPSMLILKFKELLLRKLEQSSLLSKLEMMRLLQLLPRPPHKKHSSKRLLLLPLPNKLNLRESPWLLTTKFKLPLRNSRDNKKLRLICSPNKRHLRLRPRDLLKLRLLDSLLRLRRRLDSSRKLPRPPLPKLRLKLLLLKRKLMRTLSLIHI